MGNYFKHKELQEEVGYNLDKQEEILQKAKDEGRELTDREQQKIHSLEREYESLKKEIREETNNRSASSPPYIGSGRSSEEGVELWESISGPSKGKQIRVLHNNRSLYRDLREHNPADFTSDLTWAKYLRNRIAGYTADNPLQPGETRVMDTSADSALVPTPLSAQVIDKARNMSRVFQAGARTVPMDSKTLDLARVTDDVDTEWKAENNSFSASDVTVDKVTLTAKTLIAGTKMSVELSEDAPNASEIIQNSLSESLALELDRVALVGSGSGQEPEGLFENSNVQEVSMGSPDGSVIDDYTELSQAYQKVLEKNGVPRSAIYAPRTFGQLDRLTDNDDNPLRSPQSWQDLQKLVTNQVPIDQTQGSELDSSAVFIGDFTQMLVGIRTNLRIEVSRVASDSSGHAWEDLQVWIRAYMRSDIQFAHPDHFCRVVGLIGTVGT